MKENRRRCYKCGSSPADNPSIHLHRFPKPGKSNILRCELWAKYCFPNDAWSSPEFQAQLYREHRMLCNKHFKASSFLDKDGKRMLKSAAPDEECDKALNLTVIETKAGPSGVTQHQVLGENINVLNTKTASDTTPLQQQLPFYEPMAGPSMVTQHVSVEENKSVATVAPTPQQVSNVPVSDMTKKKERYLYMQCRKHMKKISKLQKTMKTFKNEAFLNALLKDDSVNEMMKYKLSPSFALLLQGQLQNFKKKSRGRRWNTESKIIALRLYKRSPTCYKLLRRLICLPTPSTLKSLLNKFHLGVGINGQIFSVLKKTLMREEPCNKEYVLMFDEMSIKKNLSYNKKEDVIEGFQDHAAQGRSPQVASHALVFMVAGIRKKVKQPVAYYFSGGSVTADRLAVLLKEVLQHCFDAGLKISATVCDLDGVNKRALGILGATVEQPCIKVCYQEVVTLLDTPHLLKCFRNLFLKYDIKCPTNISSNENRGIGTAKWSHIKQFYELDNSHPNFSFAPCLKQEHLNPNTKQKMRVKLVAQVLSHSVAGGMFAKISNGELPAEATTTANVLWNMDKLFDSVNASTPDLRAGKPFSTNLKSDSPHLQHFKEMKYFFKNLEFLGCRRAPPSQEGWIWTLNGIERLWNNLRSKHKSIKSLATRRLQQDPLENLFGCIRSNCGSNTNPTAGQFVAGLKTAVLSNLSHIGVGNYEKDENDVVLENYKTLLTQATDIRSDGEATNIESDLIQRLNCFEDESIEETTSEIQACAYVCGFIVKNNPIKCEDCKKAFVSDSQDVIHNFVEFKEYDDTRKSLIYASKDLTMCVERSATMINKFLENEAYKKNLKDTLTQLLRNSINFDFLDCCADHRDLNINYLIKSVFHITIKRFCILKNRQFAEEASASALKRKIDILKHK